MPHRARSVHRSEHPVHVTLRASRRLAVLRKQAVFSSVRNAIAHAATRFFRIVVFSVQSDHLHLLVEAKDREALGRGARGLAIRVARAVNRVLGRRGHVWGDRYHRRDLASPREVRNALVYVLMNHKKHESTAAGRASIDPHSSAAWFDGWRPAMRVAAARGDPPVAAPRTWLLSTGWRRHGLLSLDESPLAARRGILAARS